MMPRRLSGRPIVAVLEKTRKVDARANSRPPPRAIDDIAAMEGMGREERLLRVWRREVRKFRVLMGVILLVSDCGGGNLERKAAGVKRADDCDGLSFD